MLSQINTLLLEYLDLIQDDQKMNGQISERSIADG